jgi:cobalt-zinc-cadmium efflux system protein
MHEHDHHTSNRRLGWTIVFNLAITVAEFVGGFISGYLALVADAVHNLSDVAALVLAWLGARGAALPATKRSTYGLKRLEVITALTSAVGLVVVAVFIVQEAYDRFVNPQPIGHPALFLTVAVIGLIGNLLSVKMLHSERDHSLNLKTAFLHMTFDALSSVAVIVGGIVILLTGFTRLDAVLAALIGVLILLSSYGVIKEAVLVLLEAAPDRIDFDAVREAVAQTDRVRSVHHLHIWSLSSREVAMSCHICLDEADLPRGPEVIGLIAQALEKKFGIGHVTVQVEKFDCQVLDLSRRRDNQG